MADTLKTDRMRNVMEQAKQLVESGQIDRTITIRQFLKLVPCRYSTGQSVLRLLFNREKDQNRIHNTKKKEVPTGPAGPSGAAGVSTDPVSQEGPSTTLQESSEVTENEWKITLPKTRIHTLEELIKFFAVDLETWEVERFIANKWEVAGKFGDKGSEEFVVEPLYQVKAFLRRKRFSDMGKALDENAKLTAKLAQVKVDLVYERKINKRLAQNHAGYDEWLVDLKDITAALGDWKLPMQSLDVPVQQMEPAVTEGHDEDAVLLFSDFHFADKIRPEDVSGFPEYDLVIGGNRLGYVVQKAKQVLTLHRAMYPIKKLIIWIGGDIGNGSLHDSPESNELFPPAQVHFSYLMLVNAINDLLTLAKPDLLGRKVIEEIVLLFSVGNHMRLDEKMPHKMQAQRTFDWLIYQFVIEKFKDNPLVTIRTEYSPFIFESIRGHRYMFAHGMQVGYRNNPEVQSKRIGDFLQSIRALFDSPEWRAKNGLTGETFARICVGDIHVPVSFPRFKSNGSLNGQNELGVNWTLEPIPAGQQLFGVSNKHQETWSYFLECTHVQRRPEDMNPYGEAAIEYQKRFGR